MVKNIQMGFFLAVVVGLSGCIDAKRFGNGYTPDNKEKHNPQFKACESSINKAYALMNRIKRQSPAKGTYKQWSVINEWTAEALSAMENRQYSLCQHKANVVRGEIILNILHKPLSTLHLPKARFHSKKAAEKVLSSPV